MGNEAEQGFNQIIKYVHETTAPHSVEVGRTAKGETTFNVKVYAASPLDAANEALQVIKVLREKLGL